MTNKRPIKGKGGPRKNTPANFGSSVPLLPPTAHRNLPSVASSSATSLLFCCSPPGIIICPLAMITRRMPICCGCATGPASASSIKKTHSPSLLIVP